MEAISDNEYEQILKLVKQLPPAKAIQLKIELEEQLNKKTSKKKISSYRGILKGIDIKDFESYLEKNR